jgi:hypothetical protein
MTQTIKTIATISLIPLEHRALRAIQDALSRLENMNSKDFAHGADKPIRDEFEAIMSIAYAQGFPRKAA